MVLMFGQGFDSLQLHKPASFHYGSGFFMGLSSFILISATQSRFSLYLFCLKTKKDAAAIAQPITHPYLFSFIISLPTQLLRTQQNSFFLKTEAAGKLQAYSGSTTVLK